MNFMLRDNYLSAFKTSDPNLDEPFSITADTLYIMPVLLPAPIIVKSIIAAYDPSAGTDTYNFGIYQVSGQLGSPHGLFKSKFPNPPVYWRLLKQSDSCVDIAQDIGGGTVPEVQNRIKATFGRGVELVPTKNKMFGIGFVSQSAQASLLTPNSNNAVDVFFGCFKGPSIVGLQMPQTPVTIGESVYRHPGPSFILLSEYADQFI